MICSIRRKKMHRKNIEKRKKKDKNQRRLESEEIDFRRLKGTDGQPELRQFLTYNMKPEQMVRLCLLTDIYPDLFNNGYMSFFVCGDTP